MQTKKILSLGLRILLSLVFLAGALWVIDLEELRSMLKQASLTPFLLAIFALILSTFICAFRWWAVSKAIGLKLRFKTACTEYFGCTFFNHVLPGGVVGDIARIWRQGNEGTMTKSAHSVIAERLMGQTSFVIFMVIALPFLLTAPDIEKRWALVSFFAVVAGAYGIAAFMILKGKHLPGKAGKKIQEFHDALFDLGLKNAIKMIVVSLGMVTCFAFAFYFCAKALALNVPFALLIASVPLLKATMMLPISVGGWGFREGTAAAIWTLAGLPAAEGIAISIAYGLAFILSSLPGIVFWSDLNSKAWKKSSV